MKSGFAIAPKIDYTRHHHRKDRREQRLQVIPNKEIFLARLAHYGRRINGVAAMRDRFAMKDRVFVFQRVITIMIAEGAFRPALMWWRVTNQSKFGFGNQTMRRTDRVLHYPQLLTAQERREDQLRDVFRERRNCGND